MYPRLIHGIAETKRFEADERKLATEHAARAEAFLLHRTKQVSDLANALFLGKLSEVECAALRGLIELLPRATEEDQALMDAVVELAKADEEIISKLLDAGAQQDSEAATQLFVYLGFHDVHIAQRIGEHFLGVICPRSST